MACSNACIRLITVAARAAGGWFILRSKGTKSDLFWHVSNDEHHKSAPPSSSMVCRFYGQFRSRRCAAHPGMPRGKQWSFLIVLHISFWPLPCLARPGLEKGAFIIACYLRMDAFGHALLTRFSTTEFFKTKTVRGY